MLKAATETATKALDHSVAQLFLVFSGILVVSSIVANVDENYIFISFLTLFYALTNFKIEGIRKHESLGRHAVGDTSGVAIYSLISWFLLAWWIAGVTFLLQNICLPNWFICGTIFIYVLVLPGWIIFILLRKHQPKKDGYEIHTFCKNCGKDESKTKIPFGRPLNDHPCTTCGLYMLEKVDTASKKDEVALSLTFTKN